MTNHIPISEVAGGHRTGPRQAAVASLVGAVLDWYDFFIFGLFAALVFAPLFFTKWSPGSCTLLAIATFGVGFLARPVGGVLFGHFGDKLGRRAMLVLTLLMMGFATALVGLLPTYADVGVWAPVLLVALRLVQGVALGGEWGGATLMAVEHAPPSKRGFYGSFVQVGASLGLLIATLVVSAVSALTTEEQFLSWGWRIPFLLSLVVVAAGFLIRRRVDESPEFVREVKEPGAQARIPLLEAIRHHPGAFLLIIGLRLVELVTFFVVTVFALSYGTTNLGLDRTALLNATIIVAGVAVFLIPLMGALSDRIGRKKVYVTGAAIGVIGAFPLFWALESRSIVLIVLAFVFVANLSHDLVVAVQQPLFTEMFGAAFRYSGAGVAYQLASAIAGGFTPLIAAALVLAAGGGYLYVALYLMGACMVSLICGLLLKSQPVT